VIRFAAILMIFLCLSVPPLERLPFATTVPMAAIASFGLALTLCDRLLRLLGFLISAVTVVMGFGLLGS
jgi:hypothetical protein